VTTYRLGSAPMVYTPSIVAWAVNGGHFKKDVAAMANVIAEGWGVPVRAARMLVTSKVPYKVVGDAVVFSVPEAK
jgi:hypothetical protein